MSRWSVALGVFTMLGLFLLGVALARASDRVDVALVLAVDASASMNEEDRGLQREGYAAALASPEVVGVILHGKERRIAVMMFEWGSASEQVVILGWTIIDGPRSASQAADAIRAAKPVSIGQTSILGALTFSAVALRSAPAATRHVVDVSGDGPDNGAYGLRDARDALLAAGVTINGLPILGDPSASDVRLDDYYADNVIGGEGSFLIPAYGFGDFARAVRAKLMTEVAGVLPRTRFAGGR